MKPELFRISLSKHKHREEEELYFFPGETVEGVVVIVISPENEFRYKGITLTIGGNSFVSRTKIPLMGAGKVRLIMPKGHSYKEKYFDKLIDLQATTTAGMIGDVGGGGGSPDTTIKVLTPGHHEYPFKFTFPLGIPSSFEGDYGNVRYEIRAKLEREFPKEDCKVKMFCPLHGIFDLNKDPLLAEPFKDSRYKHIRNCCKWKHVGFKVELPKTGYLPGEMLSFDAEFVNTSPKCAIVVASLLQKFSFPAHGMDREELVKSIVKANGPALKAGGSRKKFTQVEMWTGDIFEIPSELPPTNLGGGGIIGLEYCLKIKMVVSKTLEPLVHEIPIVIGTVLPRRYSQETSEIAEIKTEVQNDPPNKNKYRWPLIGFIFKNCG